MSVHAMSYLCPYSPLDTYMQYVGLFEESYPQFAVCRSYVEAMVFSAIFKVLVQYEDVVLPIMWLKQQHRWSNPE